MTHTSVWDGRTVLVTGGAGFLGRHLVKTLQSRSDDVEVVVPRRTEYDLRERGAIRGLLQESGAEVVIHLAATVGGVGEQEARPGSHFYDNAKMGIELLEQARQFGVEKVTLLGTVSSYPKDASIPFTEEELFDGYPETPNAPYGIAKRVLVTQSHAYRRQWGFNSICLLPVNVYGPGDNFDSETANVIPALIRKCIEARDREAKSITVWGTGEQTRDFLYVKDTVDGILDATERYDRSDPVNLGSGEETSIHDLVRLIADETGFEGTIEWDTSKPEGQPRQLADMSKAAKRFGWRASTDIRDGLRETIQWYERTRRN